MARLSPELRRKVIFNAALKVTKRQQSVHGWTRQDVAEACTIETSAETVKHYFPNHEELRIKVGDHPEARSCLNEYRDA